MTPMTNKMNHIAVIFATILILITPLIEPTATMLLAVLGLIVMTIFSRKQMTQRSAIAAGIGFVVALVIALGMRFWHR